MLTAVPVSAAAQQPAVSVAADFVYEEAPFPSAHASTIVETADGLATAWFGGTAERNPDVGIWLSRHDGTGWSPPVEVANGIHEDGRRYPCWNPVLFQPSRGPLLLFYKIGPSPSEWWGLVRTSSDQGRTWSDAIRLPDGVLGPIRAKPIELSPGTLFAGSSTEHDGWVVHMERFSTEAQTEDGWQRALASSGAWEQSRPLNDPDEYSAIQPTILVHSTTELQTLCRSQQGLITRGPVDRWRSDLGPDVADRPAKPERRHRCTAAEGRPVPARLQPDDARSPATGGGGLRRRPPLATCGRSRERAGRRVLLPGDDPGG